MGNIVDSVLTPDRKSKTEQGARAAEIQKALYEILRSAPFRASKQSQQLLQYIVSQSLDGHLDRLKERVIGAEVFGRPVDYDTNEDPIVRSRAAEVRKRLAQYYVGEGSGLAIRIEISPGSYHATFSEAGESRAASSAAVGNVLVLPHAQPDAVPLLVPSDGSQRPGRTVPVHSKLRWWILGCSLALVLILLAGLIYSRRPKDLVNQFWSPLLDTPKPVLIYTGANAVYMPSDQLIERFKNTHHLNELDTGGYEFLVPITADQKLGPGDLLEMKNQFVTLGDVSANVKVTTLLDRFNHPFDLRSGEDVSFGDLRDTPVILIGAFNNAWTLQLTGDLPFVFGSGLTIRDQTDKARQWHPDITPENKVQMDYALVARLPHSKTGGALIAIAGITQSGTRAAAEFITSSEGLKDLMRSAPDSWATKNLEVVLQTKVVNDIPTNPTIVAVRTW
jgi:hypothetical protein